MASLPLLSSRDGVQVVAALLGHSRHPPHKSHNIRALDRIFEEVVDSLRQSLPLRADIETGAAAVASVLHALQSDLPSASSTSLVPSSRPPSTSSSPLPLPPPPPPPLPASSSPPSRPHPQPHPQQQLHPSRQERRRPPRKKRYHDAVPSTHCHICCRPNTAVDIAVCSNIKEGTCRKVVCNRCITDNGWDWENAIKQGSDWICPHCKDSCSGVPRAQCWVYMRTNSRRKMNGMKNKKARVSMESAASTAAAAAADASQGTSHGGALMLPPPPPSPSPQIPNVSFAPFSPLQTFQTQEGQQALSMGYVGPPPPTLLSHMGGKRETTNR